MKTPVSIGLRLLTLCLFGVQLPVAAAESNSAASLYLVRKNGWFGYVDRQGKTVIKPEYFEARGFKEGMACVKVEGKYGFIDTSGKLIVQPQYLAADDFSDGLASVTLDLNKWGYVNTKGTLVIPLLFEVRQRYDAPFQNAQGVFSEGLAFVRLAGSKKSGYIDKNGQFVIQNEGLSGSPFSEGLAFVTPMKVVDTYGRPTDRQGYINTSGKFMIARDLVDGGRFSEGLAMATFRNGGKGFIDKKGQLIFQTKPRQRYIDDEGFSEGLCRVEREFGNEYKFGFINRAGEMSVPAKFAIPEKFSEGYSAALDGSERDDSGKWGYINQKGEWVIPPTFSNAQSFSGGLAIVEIGGSWQQIGMMRKLNDSKWALIDRTGKYVWGPSE